MAEPDSLRQDLLEQTARIRWHELQPHYARGALVLVGEGMDLVETALQLRLELLLLLEEPKLTIAVW